MIVTRVATLFCTCLLIITTVAPRFSLAQVYTLQGKRYYRIGEKEFILNARDRLNEKQATHVLALVETIYRKRVMPPGIRSTRTRLRPRATDFSDSQTVWDTLDEVYDGGMYGEIMLLILKTHLNYLFGELRRPAPPDEVSVYSGIVTRRENVNVATGSSDDRLALGKSSHKYDIFSYGHVSTEFYSFEATDVLEISDFYTRLDHEERKKAGRFYVDINGVQRWYADGIRSFQEHMHKNEIETRHKEHAMRFRSAGVPNILTQRATEVRHRALRSFSTSLDSLLHRLYATTPSEASIRVSGELDQLLVTVVERAFDLGKSIGEGTARNLGEELAKVIIQHLEKEQSRACVYQECEEHNVAIRREIRKKKDF